MSENGQGTKKSFIGEALGLLEDQIELVALEWQYEKSHSLRRILAVVFGVLFAVAAFSMMLVAAVLGLVSLGLTTAQACLILGGILAVIAAILLLGFTQRDPQAGPPFQGSREEARKNIQWIRRFF